MKEAIAKIEETDSNKILILYKKEKVLERLLSIANMNETLNMVEIQSNYALIKEEIEDCWQYLKNKYNLATVKDGKWTIDFHSHLVYLI